MVHGIRLLEGEAKWYRNRYVGSTELSKFRGQDDIPGYNWNAGSGGQTQMLEVSQEKPGRWSKPVAAL